MSAEKKHDYHLVDPSPWPIYVSFSCFSFSNWNNYFTCIKMFRGAMYLGLALVIYGGFYVV